MSTDKTLIKITDKVTLNPTDISSLEFRTKHTNYWGAIFNQGTIVTMKSGRKIFVEFLTPDEVEHKIQGEL